MTQPVRLPFGEAMAALGRCLASTARLLAQGRVHLPTRHVGRRLRFADGTSAVVYRETVVDRDQPDEPCVLVVEFRLRGVRGWGHRFFRWESLFNTALFVGFPGFVSKLWLAHDANGFYRGLYEWDGVDRAESYVRALWWALAVVCEKDSIHHHVVCGIRRDATLARPELLAGTAGARWWQLVNTA
jgi:hypothetical protein